jgi:hypothetical protein
MKASTNNRAQTVLDVFHKARGRFGTPSRMRGDRGGENIEVAVWMIKHRGRNRASFMWGSYVVLFLYLLASLIIISQFHS